MQDPLDILIVDNEAGIRITLAEIMENEGYKVVVAGNGNKGIDAAEKTNLIMIDFKFACVFHHLHEKFMNLTKHKWITNEKFFVEFTDTHLHANKYSYIIHHF